MRMSDDDDSVFDDDSVYDSDEAPLSSDDGGSGDASGASDSDDDAAFLGEGSSGSEDDVEDVSDAEDSEPEVDYSAGPPASEADLRRAFFAGDVGADLDDAVSDVGRRHLRGQRTAYAHVSGRQGVLARDVFDAAMSDTRDPREWGGDRRDLECVGFVEDADGVRMAHLQKRLPPPNKDYSHAHASGAARLASAHGVTMAARHRKHEVEAVLNGPDLVYGDAELTDARDAEVREFALRESYMNQDGMQPASAFDTGRDMYDGWNLRRSAPERAPTLEHTWRHATARPLDMRAPDASVEEAPVDATFAMRRAELAPAFARAPAAHHDAISLRSIEDCPMITHKSRREGALSTRAADAGAATFGGQGQPLAPAQPAERPDGHRQAEGGEAAVGRGPVRFAARAFVAPGTDAPEQMRQTQALPTPKPVSMTEWQAHRPAEAEREGADDDEVAALTLAASSPLAAGAPALLHLQGADHVGGDSAELSTQARRAFELGAGASMPPQLGAATVHGQDACHIFILEYRYE